MLAAGSILFFNLLPNEPWWAEWFLGPMLFYIGGPFAIVGVAIYLFGEPAAHKNSPGMVKAHR